MLVTLAVIAVLAGAAIVGLRFDRSEQQLDDSLYRFQQFYRAARDQALLSGKPLRLVYKGKTLTIQQRQQYDATGSNQPGAWQALISDSIPTTFTVSDHQSLKLIPAEPVYLLPSGQTTPFRLQITTVGKPAAKQQAQQRRLSGDAMGRLVPGQ